MYARERRGGRARRLASAVGAIVVSAALLGILGFGYGAIPALGPVLDPGRGAWTSAAGGDPVTSQTLRVRGLSRAVTVSFTSGGLASISAAGDRDMFLALGYVHARFRLSEMDAERRLGEGRLAELAGSSDVGSDEFELRLGLLRTARNEWARITGPARQALLAYAQGVNDDIAQVRAAGDWPALFSLTGTYPRPWTPVDSLVVQGVLTQELDYTTSPLDYALLERSLGAKNTMAWFPVLPANTWTPYDSGPRAREPLTAVPPDVASSAPGRQRASLAASSQTAGGGRGATIRSGKPGAVAEAAGQLLAQLSRLPAGQIHDYPDSNAWAANGPAVAGGSHVCVRGDDPPGTPRCGASPADVCVRGDDPPGTPRCGASPAAILGGDPHLPQTLPSIWYEVALSAPGYQAAGATVPGVPGVLLGHNAHIAWSLTDTQNEAAFYYAEQVRGDDYFWRGSWRPMTVVRYTIGVRGGTPVRLKVDITAHGPVMTQAGQTMAVDWMGNVPSDDDLSALLAINQAANWTQFKAALAGWRAPTQNFTYADNDPVPDGASGNIGVYAAGYYPQVPAGCQPWLPMPGTGSCDITGVIPYDAIPQVYDPPSHLVATDNQRPASASYPYYIGTSADFFDPGYRAGYAYESMRAGEPLSAPGIAALQNSVTDPLAADMVPKLLAALGSSSALTPAQRSAASLLRSWNYSMDAGSAAATVWWTFWGDYVSGVFSPWWKAGHVPTGRDPLGLTVGTGLVSLDEDLQAWTTSDPSNPAFRGPSGHGFSGAPAAMAAAFGKAVSHLSESLGGAPPTWTWGRIHSRAFPSVTGADGLGYGPRASGGDPFTENAADGGMTSSIGPSWRMVVSLPSSAPLSAEGVYPGGQSENPASPWYANLVPLWWDGRYLPVPAPGSAGDGARWALDG